MYKINDLRDLLRANGHKVTDVRESVYRALVDNKRPLSNAELTQLLTDVDKVSVYRTLALFESIGVIDRIWTGFKSKVELGELFSPHHHHFTCNSCGDITSFKSEQLEKELTALEDRLGVTVKQHHIELSGVCGRCSERKDQSKPAKVA